MGLSVDTIRKYAKELDIALFNTETKQPIGSLQPSGSLEQEQYWISKANFMALKTEARLAFAKLMAKGGYEFLGNEPYLVTKLPAAVIILEDTELRLEGNVLTDGRSRLTLQGDSAMLGLRRGVTFDEGDFVKAIFLGESTRKACNLPAYEKLIVPVLRKRL
jgi:hypothetical protein